MKSKEMLLMGTLILIFLLGITPAAAEVVVFREYITNMTLEKDYFHIERKITLENIGRNPIIPGELHFRLHEIRGDKQLAPSVSNFKARTRDGRDLETDVIEGSKESDLIISIWDALLPNFYYTITVQYDVKFKPNGILFFFLSVPVEDTTIPIRNEVNTLNIPKKYQVTYAPGVEVSKTKDHTQLQWKDTKQIEVEYTVLPLPKLSIKAVNVFWIAIIVILVAIAAIIRLKRR